MGEVLFSWKKTEAILKECFDSINSNPENSESNKKATYEAHKLFRKPDTRISLYGPEPDQNEELQVNYRKVDEDVPDGFFYEHDCKKLIKFLQKMSVSELIIKRIKDPRITSRHNT